MHYCDHYVTLCVGRIAACVVHLCTLMNLCILFCIKGDLVMKKLVKLISVVMLIAMMFSILNVGAFADGTAVVFDENGTDINGGSSGGNLVISGDPNNNDSYANDKPVTSASANGGSASDDEPATVKNEAGYTLTVKGGNAAALEYFKSEKMLEENPMIYYNADYIVYIRENMESLKQTNPKVVESAYELFGAEYMDKEFETTVTLDKSAALKMKAEYVEKIIEALKELDESDPDSVLAVRTAAGKYTEAFSGAANYDFTLEESSFSSAAEALEAAREELASINAEIEKLANGDKEIVPSPSPVPSEKPVDEEEDKQAENPDADEDAENDDEQPEDVSGEPSMENLSAAVSALSGMASPVLLTSPLKMFASLFALPAYTAAELTGQTKTLAYTTYIYGLPDWPIVVCLNEAKLTAPTGQYAFAVNDPNTVVTIEACTIYGNAVDVSAGNVTLKYVKVVDSTPDGFPAVRVNGGRLEVGNCELDSAEATLAINNANSELAINGYNKIGTSSTTLPAVQANGGTVKIDATGTSESLISGVRYIGLEVNGAKVSASGYAKISGLTGVKVNSGSFSMSDNVVVEGVGKGTTFAAIQNAGGDVYVAGGTLRGEYCYAVLSADPSRTYIANGEQVIQTSKYDSTPQYTTGIIIVNDVPYGQIQGANGAQAAVTALEAAGEPNINIKLLGDVDAGTNSLTLSNPGTSYSVNGNGHTIKSSSCPLIINAGNVTVSGITLESTGGDAITISGTDPATTVYITGNTILKGTTDALYAEGTCTVYVNDAVLYGDYGFYVKTGDTDAKVKVNSCKDNAKVPIRPNTERDGLIILGGYYLYRGTAPYSVEDYLATGISTISNTVNKDGYYVVSLEYTPAVKVVNGTTGVDSNKIPYVTYDKANPKYITFNVDSKVLRIDAIPIEGGTAFNVFNYEATGGKDGDITIDIDAFQNNIGSGVYDLQFKFKNGYVMTQRLHLYVLPETAKLVARAWYQDCSDYYNVPAKDINYAVSEYTVGSKAYIYAEVSELPTKIGVSSDPNGSEVNWFGYYSPVVDGKKVLQKADSKDYFILVDYAFLDQLPSGQCYVFLDYNGAIKRVNLKIVNPNVAISPTSLDFWGKDSAAVFTVTPDVKDVYIDGELVPTQFLKYDENTHKLTVSGEYLEHIKSGTHLMEVETSRGWVSATIHTGVGLAPDGVDYHVYGGTKALAFKASDKIDTTAGIYIGKNNPTKIDPSLIYFYDNDTKFTVSPSYLNRLSLGTYYISAYVWNPSINDYEYTSTTFRIISASSAAYNPGTGDTNNQVVWIVIAALAAVIAAVFLIPALKKSKATADVAKTAEAVEEVNVENEEKQKEAEAEEAEKK